MLGSVVMREIFRAQSISREVYDCGIKADFVTLPPTGAGGAGRRLQRVAQPLEL